MILRSIDAFVFNKSVHAVVPVSVVLFDGVNC